MAMGVNLATRLQSVHVSMQVEQVLADIYEGGVILTTGAKVMPFRTHNACEQKGWGDVTLGRMHNHPATSVSLCISGWPATGSAPYSVPILLWPHTFLDEFSKFLWSPIRSANLSCAPVSRCSVHGCPPSRG